MNQSLTITYKAKNLTIDESLAPWLTLEQEYVPESSQAANLSDITEMWHMALSGLSPINYHSEHCPVMVTAGVVTVYLGIYVFPSAQDLIYQLTLSNGITRDMRLRTVTKEYDVLIPQFDNVALDFVPEEIITLDWQTDAYNAFGEQIDTPDITVEKNILKFSTSCFGVLRLKATTIAHYYPVEISVTKAVTTVDTEAEAAKKEVCIKDCNDKWGPESDNWHADIFVPCIQKCSDLVAANRPPNRTGFKITNLRSTAQATWQGLEKVESKSLSLKIPTCVTHLLEMCDDGQPKGFNLKLDADKDESITAYYSSCTGNLLDVIIE